jgi:lysozyme family protein
MADLFDEAMRVTLGHEGGWYDGSDPRDPNPTMYGVIQKNYDLYRDSKKLPRQSVRMVTPNELRDIYADYWYGTVDVVARFFPLTALNLFDIAINAGAGTARKLLQRSLDLAEDGKVGDLDDDGKLGPRTLGELAHLHDSEPAGFSDEHLCLWLLMERVRYYDTVAETPRLRPNLKSWIGRTVKFYNEYIRT